MKGDKKRIWVEAAYHRFAAHGEAGLTVEAIARDLNRNKSSFYHYFGELQVLKADMLQWHLEASKKVGEEMAVAEKLDPDVLKIILNYKMNFLFQKQLKLAEGESYKQYDEQAFDCVRVPLLEKLSEALNIEKKQLFSTALLNLASDNFLLRIQESNLTLWWLRDYVEELRSLTRHIQ